MPVEQVQTYRKRPVLVQAYQFHDNGQQPIRLPLRADYSDGRRIVVSGKQGWVEVHDGDWIIAELDGSGHYPCKPDVFAATYEVA